MATEWWRERLFSVTFQWPFNDHSVDWMAGTFHWLFSQFILCLPEPKAQVSLSYQNLSIVHRRCCCNLSHFHLLQNHSANFHQTLHKASLDKGDSSLFKWRALPFSKGRWLWKSENTLRNFKIFFSRTTEPISTKLGTNHPWVKGIQVRSKEGPPLFSKGR